MIIYFKNHSPVEHEVGRINNRDTRQFGSTSKQYFLLTARNLIPFLCKINLNYHKKDQKCQYITCTNDLVISERMATAGYTPEEMQNGKQLVEGAEEAYEVNHKEKGEYNEARDNHQEAKNAFHDKYIRDLEFTRIALSEDPKKLEYIGATGRRSRTQAAYLTQAKHFCSSLEQDENLLQKMARFGYTGEMMKERLDDIEELYQLMEKIESEEGDAQHQIQVRNEKLDELEDWTSVYKKVALLMFEDDAQYLEKLGIVMKS
ncbi:MAG: hypothetical protein V5A51_09760 [Bacteroidales bacterium]